MARGSKSLAAARSCDGLRQTIRVLARRTGGLLEQSRPFAGRIADRRLGLEVGVIQSLAENLVQRLGRRDPLCERVHHRPIEALGLALRGAGGVMAGWLGRAVRPAPPAMRGSGG